MDNNNLSKLREPFPLHQISKLPKPTVGSEEYKKLQKSRCDVCGGWHPKDKTIHLDYVGHAALTDRLLDTDLLWSWEPMALDEHGLPRFDQSGGLWIKLTICGFTRLGYGNAKTNSYADVGSREKEVIGDAIRNAAMRGGAALDLWHKGDLHIEEDTSVAKRKEPITITPDPVDTDTVNRAVDWFKKKIDEDNEENWRVIQQAYGRLSPNEIMAVDSFLDEKAPGSNVKYKNILKKYLNHVPSEGIKINE